jgi:hypothetical protein
MLPRVLPVLLAVVLLAACDFTNGSDENDDPLSQPEFLTPVAEAQDAGVEIWWLGPQVDTGARVASIDGVAELIDDNGGPAEGVELGYGGLLRVRSFAKQARRLEEMRESAMANDPSGPESVMIGLWDAELFSVPGPGRPTNRVRLFIETGEAVVVVSATSGSTGVPETDVNPLIGEELLSRLVTDELRPYPE